MELQVSHDHRFTFVLRTIGVATGTKQLPVATARRNWWSQHGRQTKLIDPSSAAKTSLNPNSGPQTTDTDTNCNQRRPVLQRIHLRPSPIT